MIDTKLTKFWESFTHMKNDKASDVVDENICYIYTESHIILHIKNFYRLTRKNILK